MLVLLLQAVRSFLCNQSALALKPLSLRSSFGNSPSFHEGQKTFPEKVTLRQEDCGHGEQLSVFRDPVMGTGRAPRAERGLVQLSVGSGGQEILVMTEPKTQRP